MKAKVFVTLKNGVLDPQGEAVLGALHSMGQKSVKSLRQGKYFEVELESSDKSQAESTLKEICGKVLANTVIENFKFELE